jgi:rubrerythrin
MKSFAELTEREILALAISSEEEDGRVYSDFAEGLRENYPDTAQLFYDMAAEESEHRRSLIDLFVAKFGEHIPYIRRQDIRGTVQRKRLWQVLPLGVDYVRRQAQQMEQDAARFYQQAAARTTDAAIRKLLGDLAEAERQHERNASESEAKHLTPGKKEAEHDSAQRRFVLQIIQPGLVGLMACRRYWPYPALSHQRLRHGHDYRGNRRRDRASGDRVDSMALHGHATLRGSRESHAGRRPGARGRDFDRQYLNPLRGVQSFD